MARVRGQGFFFLLPVARQQLTDLPHSNDGGKSEGRGAGNLGPDLRRPVVFAVDVKKTAVDLLACWERAKEAIMMSNSVCRMRQRRTVDETVTRATVTVEGDAPGTSERTLHSGLDLRQA